MTVRSILWRRLDGPGHDACRLEPAGKGWRLDGAAVFQHGGRPACLTYHVVCDADWRTREGVVSGWVGARSVEAVVRRTSNEGWSLNGTNVPDVDRCEDLDFGFTPATNLLQLRRVALEVGQGADVPVAWLDVLAGHLDVLDQRYERRTSETYWYEAPRFGYAALLEIDAVGFARRYPGLWVAEP